MGKSGKRPKNGKNETWGENILQAVFKLGWLQLPGAVKDSIQAYNEYHSGRQMRQQLPAVMTLLENLVAEFGKHNYATIFAQFLSLLGAMTHLVHVLQGDSALRGVLQDIGVKIAGDIEAQTGLKSPRFAKQVHRFIYQRTKEMHGDCADHFFFVYHPDTDWHPEFFSRVEADPLPTNFLGMSSNLDTLCIWMLFIRSLFTQSKIKRETYFHILIPTYRPLVIRDPIIFPAALYPLKIEGHIHNSIFRVWLNIPNSSEGNLELHDVGNLAAPPSFWQQWAGTIEGVTFCGTWMAGCGAAMGLSAAAAVIATPLAIAAFLAGASAAAYGTVTAVDAVQEKTRIPAPRLLGGDLSQDALEFQLRTRRVRRRHRRRHE
ncbi:hypothetical protein CC80DRAFT_495484 [Byssothecium circinans]|uniref:Uncharacterized protein n=1 Tax=Byssothecium circinans TaxID=147558 RepID=A0A6A5TIF0_9PLEO|nr:hypothetical protein CC80DRAFT_495484 [Byssothecium circinans]